jgi:hypothetical protein
MSDGTEAETIRVQVYETREEVDNWEDTEPRHTVPVEPETPFVFVDDPHYHSVSLGLSIHPDDRPAELGVYTSDSVHDPPGYENHVETGYWDGPMERGLRFTSPEGEVRPFGCELWGRVMFFVEPLEDE